METGEEQCETNLPTNGVAKVGPCVAGVANLATYLDSVMITESSRPPCQGSIAAASGTCHQSTRLAIAVRKVDALVNSRAAQTLMAEKTLNKTVPGCEPLDTAVSFRYSVCSRWSTIRCNI